MKASCLISYKSSKNFYAHSSKNVNNGLNSYLAFTKGAVSNDEMHQPNGRRTIPDYELVPGINYILNLKDVPLKMAFKVITDKKSKQ